MSPLNVASLLDQSDQTSFSFTSVYWQLVEYLLRNTTCCHLQACCVSNGVVRPCDQTVMLFLIVIRELTSSVDFVFWGIPVTLTVCVVQVRITQLELEIKNTRNNMRATIWFNQSALSLLFQHWTNQTTQQFQPIKGTALTPSRGCGVCVQDESLALAHARPPINSWMVSLWQPLLTGAVNLILQLISLATWGQQNQHITTF